jgi:WXG100 family type VII secretion target
MAARITITPEELRTASTNFANKAGEVREILEYLRSEVNRLESTWDGAAQDQFFMTYEEMAKTLDQFPEVVDGISQQLSAVAQTLEETDQALADSLKG